MAYVTQIDTSTLSNQNITTALLVHTFTNTSRIRKVKVNVYLDQVAGNGDYIAYITTQLAGAGSFYESIRTTKSAGSGVTSIQFETMELHLRATDVMKVYVLGLAGDTTTPDIITYVDEEWISVDASGRVDVGAWLGSTPDALSSGKIPADIKLWLAAAPAALSASGYVQAMLLRWLTDNAAGTPLALTGANLVQADAIKLNGAVPNNLAAGAQMDLVNAPNGLAVTAIQAGLATAAKLLEYVKALARKDAGAASADIVGTYDNTTDSQEAAADAIALLAPGAAVVLNADITEIHVP